MNHKISFYSISVVLQVKPVWQRFSCPTTGSLTEWRISPKIYPYLVKNN